MMKKTTCASFWLLLTCAACFCQTSFQGLTPGASTANDVERVLGPPVRKDKPTDDGRTTFEYNALAGIAKIEVDYSDGSAFAEIIHVYFLQPITRSAIIQKFHLPQQGDATRMYDAALREYFGGQALLSLAYASSEAHSGVTRIGYFSKEEFTRYLHSVQGKPDVPSLNAKIIWFRFFKDDPQINAADHPDKRIYQSEFSQGERMSNELLLSFQAPGRIIPFTYQEVLYYPDGSNYEFKKESYEIQPSWNQLSLKRPFLKVGTENNIGPGIYRYEYLINGQHVATASFEVH